MFPTSFFTSFREGQVGPVTSQDVMARQASVWNARFPAQEVVEALGGGA